MSTPSERLVGPGDVLCDRFTLDREIGRGAVSRVFRAQDQLLGSVLALKVIRKAEAPVELAGFRCNSVQVQLVDGQRGLP